MPISGKTGLNVVTAFAHGARLSLGVIESTKAGGEILALRKLIKMLDIKGTMITADALHCQRETCELIVREGGDYCLQLKGNQGAMQADVRAFINDQITEYIDEYTSTDADHGRIEERCYRIYKPHKYLKDSHEWPHLEAFVHVTSTRELNGKSSRSERVYPMSKRLIARDSAAIIRGHWQIENSLPPSRACKHTLPVSGSLDVVMNDDQHRARKDSAPINFATLRRIALNIIKTNTDKGSNRLKLKRAGWNNDFLRSLLNDF